MDFFHYDNEKYFFLFHDSYLTLYFPHFSHLSLNTFFNDCHYRVNIKYCNRRYNTRIQPNQGTCVHLAELHK